MLETQVEMELDAPATLVWKLTGDFGGLRDWLPGVVDCWVEGEGAQEDGGNAIRVVEMSNGAITKEALIALDESRYSYRYAIIEAKGFGKDNAFQAHFTVLPLSDDRCKVVWGARFTLPADVPADASEKARQRVQQMYRLFLQHLASLL
ncbi:MAG TPA: SRPBCC family protein [Dongiaceae bacterium]|nr:SRPBCC family protein [Dongiaceae bacterium]